MSVPMILSKIRDRIPLGKHEIKEFSTGLADGTVSDAQAAAFAMAVCLNGLSEQERVELISPCVIREMLGKWNLPGRVIDKHSTGGIEIMFL